VRGLNHLNLKVLKPIIILRANKFAAGVAARARPREGSWARIVCNVLLKQSREL
jgi:hypothetical protein